MEIEALVGVIQELGRIARMQTPTVDVVLALIRLRARHPVVLLPRAGDAHAVPREHSAAAVAGH